MALFMNYQSPEMLKATQAQAAQQQDWILRAYGVPPRMVPPPKPVQLWGPTPADTRLLSDLGIRW